MSTQNTPAATPAQRLADYRRAVAARKATAADQYATLQADAANLVASLTAALAAHGERAAKAPRDWGYVGDIAEVTDRLRAAVEMLTLTQA